MKYQIRSLTIAFAALSLMLLSSCVHNNAQTEAPPPTTTDLIAKAAADPIPPTPAQLPVRYQNPGFVTIEDDKVDADLAKDEQEYQIKVGANIRSTRGPQPLWDILKRMAMLKGMSVSWSSDVDQNVLVDVDISANDNYYEAIDNLLRQVDYFHKVSGSTIIIKYKETKTYHVAMPFTHQVYETATGGNVLGSGDDTSSVEGTIRLDSRGNEFDIWLNIQENLDEIIATWSTTTSSPETPATPAAGEGEAIDAETGPSMVQVSRQTSSGGNGYTIDKPVGLITVNAPRPLQERIADYLENIKHELYKQVTIEAKIIEVQLADSSTLGIDWNLLLRSLSFGGSVALGKSYDKDTADTTDKNNSISRNITDAFGSSSISNDTGTTRESSQIYNSTMDTVAGAASTAATIMTGGASNIAGGILSLSDFNFGDFLHALSEQGNTSILANPKLSVMNGQPALITVGRNVTYIDSIESDVTSGTTVTTNYTVNTERILSGVGLSLTPVIRDDNEIIMNLVPVTSVLEEPIEYRQVGLGEVGLPIINVREMSSMVKVQDGEMLVIGGLISTVESTEGENLFPGLANVPVLKYLTGFETKVMRKRELIILLRPRII
ncbi:MAG: type II and III secretion system protein [Thermodesulfobacteriota bacterium]|nr:type II and III secretion system protein [Thermodesulfobacteriota bacterium]